MHCRCSVHKFRRWRFSTNFIDIDNESFYGWIKLLLRRALQITLTVRPFFITVRSLSLTAYRSLKQFEILPILTICNYVQIYFDQVATVNFIGGPVVARPSDGWTAGTARTFCADYLTASQAVTRCQGIPGVNIASSEDQCTDDVMVRKIIVNRSIIILMIN